MTYSLRNSSVSSITVSNMECRIKIFTHQAWRSNRLLSSICQATGTSDVRTLKYSVRDNPWILTKDRRPASTEVLQSSILSQSACSYAVLHIAAKNIHFLFVNNSIKIYRWYEY